LLTESGGGLVTQRPALDSFDARGGGPAGLEGPGVSGRPPTRGAAAASHPGYSDGGSGCQRRGHGRDVRSWPGIPMDPVHGDPAARCRVLANGGREKNSSRHAAVADAQRGSRGQSVATRNAGTRRADIVAAQDPLLKRPPKISEIGLRPGWPALVNRGRDAPTA